MEDNRGQKADRRRRKKNQKPPKEKKEEEESRRRCRVEGGRQNPEANWPMAARAT